MATAIDIERLLAQADWLRVLARRLVGSGADDVVQDTFVAALQSPPDPELPPRPWLARVAHNAARMRFRSEARRTRREDVVSAEAVMTTSGPDIAVQRLETHRMLVDLVLELEEPFRTTLVRHYFDGDTLAEIARSDGVPEGTVRWRHGKAIERLRGRLDARSSGDRRAWIVALAPVSAPAKAGTAIVIGGLVANKLVIVALVAIAGFVIWKLPAQSSSTSTSETPHASASSPVVGTAGGSSGQVATPARVVKLATAGDRQSVASRIASVQASRHSMTPRPALPETSSEPGVTLDKATVREAMRDVLPFLTQCYSDALPTLGSDHLEVAAQLSLDGDPDIGTVIDAKQLHDSGGQALPPAFDDCLRSTFQRLELPPLAEGDHVDVTYPFTFSK